MHVAARRWFFSLRLGDMIMIQRFRNYHLLRWHFLYLRYHRLSIVRKRLRRKDFNNRSFFFGGGGNRERNRNQSGDPKNCGK